MAEFKPAPARPGVAAGLGAGAGSRPPREHAGDGDHSAASPGSSCADELSTQRFAGDGNAS